MALRPPSGGLSLSAPQKLDWSKVEPLYRAGVRSLPELAEEFGVSHTAIAKHAKKNGWERDLKARIQAKADAKVSEAMVSAEGFTADHATETLRVEVEAEVQARLRLHHRKDITKYRAMGMHLAQQLDELGDEEKLPVRVQAFKALTETLARLVTMEREAYGIGDAPPPPPNETVDIPALARRIAFAFSTTTRTLQ